MSKKVNRVNVDGELDQENHHESFQAAFVHLMEILQIETMKHVDYVVQRPCPCWYRDDKCSLDLGLLENCLAREKIGQVEHVKIVLAGSCTEEFCYGSTTVFEYKNLNNTNMSDFIRKVLGK